MLPKSIRPGEGLLREYEMSPDDFRQIACILMDEAGIELTGNKEPLVYSRLIKRLRTLGLEDFAQYCALLKRDGGAQERRLLVSALTTNTTRFFRENHHFDMLKQTLLPPLIDRARHGGRVRIWSAGCSSGEEPYSIALTVLQNFPDAADYDVKILATDIDAQILETAATGSYPAAIVEALPNDQRSALFTRENTSGGPGSIVDSARSLISFKEMNLIRPWPVRGPFDVVFCRNVAIYFDAATQDRVWRGFGSVIDEGGHLFIGHSERLSAAARSMFEIVGMTAFRRVGNASKGDKTSNGKG